MTDLDVLRGECDALEQRLRSHTDWRSLRAVYLDLAASVGQLQGAAAERTRQREGMPSAREVQNQLDLFKSQVRQVGLDIRLSSEPALQMGLETCLASMRQIIELLARPA